MNIYIKRISFLFLSFALLFTACEDEDNFTQTTAAPAFVLQETGIENVFLNFATPTNPAITFSWDDDLTNSDSYDVQMSLNEDFVTNYNIGNVNNSFFTINVEDLNAAIRDAGPAEFNQITLYFRVKSGEMFSNIVKYVVATYPTEIPMFTIPSANDAFVMLLEEPTEIAITMQWTDAASSTSLGVDIVYTLEAAAVGTNFATPVTIGTVTNETVFSATNSDFNKVALGVGLEPEEAGNMEIRILAKNSDANDNVLQRYSDALIITVTPFLAKFPNLFLVGDATTAGWSPDNNNNPIFRNQDVTNQYVYTGYFKEGQFKLLETTNFQPQWGTNDGTTLANSNGGSDPETFKVEAAGYYTYNFTVIGESGTFSVEPFDASMAATYASIAIIGDATPNAWDDSNDTNLMQDPNNPHLWYINGVTLTNGGSMLIRANDSWDNVWRDTGSTELFGKAVLGEGGNIPFTAETGSYDIWFNDLDGSYVIIAN